MKGKNIIIGGDFNIVIEPSKDKEGGHISPSHTSKYRTTLKAFIETYELCDI